MWAMRFGGAEVVGWKKGYAAFSVRLTSNPSAPPLVERSARASYQMDSLDSVDDFVDTRFRRSLLVVERSTMRTPLNSTSRSESSLHTCGGCARNERTQMIWDLRDLGGADRLEAAGELREWLLTRP